MPVNNYDIETLTERHIRAASFAQGDHISDFPYTMSKTDYVKDSYSLPNGAGPFFGNMGLPSLLSVPISVVNNVHISNLLGAVHNIKDSDFNASVFLAESRNTVRGIADATSRLARSISYLRNGDINRSINELLWNSFPPEFTRVKTRLDADKRSGVLRNPSLGVSHAWLELQFGWKPLLSDIDTFAQTLANARYAPPKITARKSNRGPNGGINGSGYNDSISTIVGHASWDVSINYQSGIKLIVSGVPTFSQKLSFDTPFTGLWNSVPWSFLVDYLIPIGDFLEAKESLNKMDFSAAMKWQKTVHTARGKWLNSFGAVNTTPAIFRSVHFKRELIPVNEVKQVPLPFVRDLKKVFSVAHVTNSLALLRSSLKSWD